MSFSTGFPSIQQKNIKNIYSTNSSIDNRIQRRSIYSQRRVTKKPVYAKVTRNSELITYEYVPEYKAYIPKAPAFRVVSGEKAKEIGDRLSRPMSRVPKDEDEEEDAGSENKLPTMEDQASSIERLVKPTVSSVIRLRLRSGNDQKIKVKEIRNACERLYLPPSQRYFPMAYENWLHVDNGRWSMKSKSSSKSASGSLQWEH